MPRVTFIDHTGEERHIDANDGDNLMKLAVEHEVPGIDADCGGSCACATCHVYVDEAHLQQLGQRTEAEQNMLDLAEQVQPNSRLACRLTVFDGLRVTTPEQQF